MSINWLYWTFIDILYIATVLLALALDRVRSVFSFSFISFSYFWYLVFSILGYLIFDFFRFLTLLYQFLDMDLVA